MDSVDEQVLRGRGGGVAVAAVRLQAEDDQEGGFLPRTRGRSGKYEGNVGIHCNRLSNTLSKKRKYSNDTWSCLLPFEGVILY